MTLTDAINYVSYFMEDKQASGEFSEAWSVIFKALAGLPNIDMPKCQCKERFSARTIVIYQCGKCGGIINACTSV